MARTVRGKLLFCRARVRSGVGGGSRALPFATSVLDTTEVLARTHLDAKRGVAAAIVIADVTTRIAARTAVAGAAFVGRGTAGVAHRGAGARARAARHALRGNHLRTDYPRLDILRRLHHGRRRHHLWRHHNGCWCRGPNGTHHGRTRSAKGSRTNGSPDATATAAASKAGDNQSDGQQQGDTFHSIGSSLPRPRVPCGAGELAGGRLGKARGGSPPRRTIGRGLGRAATPAAAVVSSMAGEMSRQGNVPHGL